MSGVYFTGYLQGEGLGEGLLYSVKEEIWQSETLVVRRSLTVSIHLFTSLPKWCW